MTESNLLRSLGQVSSDQVSEVFRDYLRGSVRQMIVDAMADEVSELCGGKYNPSDTNGDSGTGTFRFAINLFWANLACPQFRFPNFVPNFVIGQTFPVPNFVNRRSSIERTASWKIYTGHRQLAC